LQWLDADLEDQSAAFAAMSSGRAAAAGYSSFN